MVFQGGRWGRIAWSSSFTTGAGRHAVQPRLAVQRRGFSKDTTTSPERSSPSRKVIFSGIQPTGIPHLGNYLGALRRWVDIQNEATEDTSIIYSLVDLHAITVRQEPDILRKCRKQSMAMLLAIGLDPQRSILFHQSNVPEHSELMWILSCSASMGYLGRMTQWKDKTKDDQSSGEKAKLGLFSYPVLQAADILVHGATHVPVGEDQAQHLEFARELAIGFNHLYGNILTPPDTIISPAKRIRSLTNPQSKMSKSHNNVKSRILLTDTADAIKAKFKAAVTDSLDGLDYDPETRPGVSNLIEIIYYAGPEATDDKDHTGKKAMAKDMSRMSLKAVKEKAAAVTAALIEPIREQYLQNIQDKKLLDATAALGAQKARENAARTMSEVKRAVGLA